MAGMTLYSMPSSGNSYKVRLLMAHLGLSYTHIACEYGSERLVEAHRSGALPLGKVPTLHLGDGRVLAESNAILFWLGEGTDWVPADPFARAQMLAWMFWEQNQHEGTVAVRAAILNYPHRSADKTPERLAALLDAGNRALGQMEAALAQSHWLAGDAPSLADIALYAYTHTAGSRGGYDMTLYPAINRWLARVAALPGHVGLDDIPS